MQPLLIVLLATFAFSNALRNVTISKCCSLEELFTKDLKCVKNDLKDWEITVYLLSKKNYLKNQLPKNWVLRENVKPSCSRPISVRSSSYLPFQNGSVFLLEYDKLVHPGNFCLDYKSGMFCLDEYNKPEAIALVNVKKCCGSNAIFSETNSTCFLMKSPGYEIDLGGSKNLVAGFPQCEKNQLVIAGKMGKNGSLEGNGSMVLFDSHVVLPGGNFCLEHVLEQAGQYPSIITCQEYLRRNSTSSDLRFTLYPIGFAISVIFLVATLAAGALLPASHHVLHWRCQTNHVACLLVGDVLLCIIQLANLPRNSTQCFLIAVSMHFLFLAAFFWLNTMCFNIWWTFRDLRPQSTEKSQERLRLRLYEVYAWGVPLLIAMIGAILDTVPASSGYDLLRPRFGENLCWFYGDMEIFAFFYGPIGTLLIINLALFALTARELTCGLWKRELVKSTSERAALGRVCMKLVVVMGVTWIADVISWAVGGPNEIWYLTDIINTLQGVLIFIVVGCQPQVLSAVKRLWCLRKHRQNGTAGTTNHHSSSSQGLPSIGDTITNTNSVTNNTTKTVPLETSC